MARPDDHIDGDRLVVVLSDQEFFYFKLPESLQELQKIEDYFINRGQLEFTYEHTSENSGPITIKSFEDYEKARETSKTAQGFVIFLKVLKIAYKKQNWDCKTCTHTNFWGEKCSICGTLRPAEGVARVFNQTR